MTETSIPVTADPRNWRNYICHRCGAEFVRRIREASKTKRVFCSKACAWKGMTHKEPAPLVPIVCANCGKTFWRLACWAKVAVNCSRKCMAEAHRNRTQNRIATEREQLIREYTVPAVSDFDRGWLVGFFDAEGMIRSRGSEGVEISACNTDLSLIRICSDILQLAGITSTVCTDKLRPNRNKHRHVVSLHNVISATRFEFCVGFLCKRKAETLRDIVGGIVVSEPHAEIFWRSSKDFRIGWITGFYEGDGHAGTAVTNGIRYGRVSFYTTDLDLLERVQFILKEDCISSSVVTRKRLNWKPCYCVHVQNKRSVWDLVPIMRPKSYNKQLAVQKILSLPHYNPNILL
jgi:DNA-directed RNA polymerase subunit RPC12/RpoP